MADTFKPCSVEGCNGSADRGSRGAKGLCREHYDRLRRTGSLLRKRTQNGEPLRFLNEVVLKYEGESCLLWPYNRHDAGYGMIWIDGKPARVSRIVCQEFYGDPPAGAQAAHSCRNPPCCNRRHLRWASCSDNLFDMIEHGTRMRGERHPNRVLLESDVRQIRALKGTDRESLSQRYGVSAKHIGKIQRRGAWAWLA